MQKLINTKRAKLKSSMSKKNPEGQKTAIHYNIQSKRHLIVIKRNSIMGNLKTRVHNFRNPDNM